MHRIWILALVVAALVPLGAGCGGGGGGPVGGGGITTADLGGTWLGPTGTATPAGTLTAPATAGGMVIDGAGLVSGTNSLAGMTGIVTDHDPLARTLRFTGTGAWIGINGMFIADATASHMVFIAGDGTFAALERDAASLLPLYQDVEFRGAGYSGYAANFDLAFNPEAGDLEFVSIDGGGSFVAGAVTTNVAPLAVNDGLTGQIQGDYVSPGPEFGNVLGLITPDRRFIAVMSCPLGAASLTECGWVALER